MSKPKIGFLGAGYIAGVHASILARDDRVAVAAVYDIKKLQAAQLAQSVGASVAHSVAEVLATCDVVYIATPNTQHTELAILAAEERKHVFCEKPMATTITDARRLLKAVERNDRVFQVGHNRRFAPVYAELKRMLTETHRPHSAHVKMNRGELLNPKWVGDPKITGGFLYETTIHMFDMLRFLFGEVKSLQAIGSKHEYMRDRRFFRIARVRRRDARDAGLIVGCRLAFSFRTRRSLLPSRHHRHARNGKSDFQRRLEWKAHRTFDAPTFQRRKVGLRAGRPSVRRFNCERHAGRGDRI
jgi:predicted dehydrogenase